MCEIVKIGCWQAVTVEPSPWLDDTHGSMTVEPSPWLGRPAIVVDVSVPGRSEAEVDSSGEQIRRRFGVLDSIDLAAEDTQTGD